MSPWLIDALVCAASRQALDHDAATLVAVELAYQGESRGPLTIDARPDLSRQRMSGTGRLATVRVEVTDATARVVAAGAVHWLVRPVSQSNPSSRARVTASPRELTASFR
jgi:hypothetical protein